MMENLIFLYTVVGQYQPLPTSSLSTAHWISIFSMIKFPVLLTLALLTLTGCSVTAETAQTPEATPKFKQGDRCDVPAAKVEGAEGILLCSFTVGQGWTLLPLAGSGVFPGQY